MPRKSRRSAFFVSVVLIIAFVSGIVFLYCGRQRAGSGENAGVSIAPETRAPVVAVYPVKRRDLVRDITLSAELRPHAVVNVYAKVSGYLRDITVDYGSIVRAGRVIATLEVPEQEAEAQRAEAAYRLAKLNDDRIRSVAHAEPGLIAQADVDKARAEYEIAEDQRDQARALLQYRVVAAPFDGVVTKRYADPGALIQQGTGSGTQAEPIVQIADTYRLRLVVQTPESIVSFIHVGMPVEVKMQATGEVIHANVARFSYDVREDTRTMHTEIDVPNADLALKPGMYASVMIVLAARRGVPAVPVQALAGGDAPTVWVVDDHDAVRRRSVQIGLQTPDYVEITRGLVPGDLVFVGDRNALTEGMQVRPHVSESISGN